MNNDPEMLVGLSVGELEALSDSLLAPSAQARLDQLLARNAEKQLEALELAELDRLLERVDQLTVVKTRARYTLQHHRAGALSVRVYIPADLQHKFALGFRTVAPTVNRQRTCPWRSLNSSMLRRDRPEAKPNSRTSACRALHAIDTRRIVQRPPIQSRTRTLRVSSAPK